MPVSITYPTPLSQFKLEQTLTFQGNADDGIVKVKLFAEQYLLADVAVTNNSWKTFYTFNRAGKRRIIAKAFDASDRLIDSDSLDIWLIEANLPVLGIDVSNHNPRIDWQAVKNANISFAFARATEGKTFVDRKFTTNWSGMKEAGIIRGAYHFFRASKTAEEQVDNFLRVVDDVLESGDLPPVVDLEAWPKNTVGKEWRNISLEKRINLAKTWLEKIEQATAKKPIIYTSQSFWQEFMNDSQEFIDYPLWVAHYTSRGNPNVPAHNWGGKGYTFWQHTDRGSLAGVSGSVDRNRFKNSFQELVALAGTSVIV